jgi:hypothetical protein
MTKKNSLFYLGVLFLLSIVFLPKDVFALGTTISDISNENFAIDVYIKEKNDSKQLEMKLSVPKVSGSYTYYTYFVKNSSDAKPNLSKYIKSDGTLKVSSSLGGINYAPSLKVAIDSDWYLANGYEYAYIIRCSKKNNKYNYEVTQRAIGVRKPDLPLVNDRYKVTLKKEFNKIVITPNFPFGGGLGSSSYGEHQLSIKVGMISDVNVFEKLRNNATDAYDSVLNYAKNNNVKVYSVPDSSAEVIFTDIKVEDNVLYYVYTTYLDASNYYRKIEGVSVFMGEDGFLVDTINWEVANYKVTTDSSGLLIFCGALAVVILIIVIYVRIKDRKEAKIEKNKKEDFMTKFMNSINDPNRQGFNQQSNTNKPPVNNPPPPPQPPQQNMPNGYQNNMNGYNNGMNNYNNNNNNMNGYPNNYNNYNNNNRF